MQGKTIAIVVVSLIIIAGIGTFNAINTKENVPAIENTNPKDDDSWKDDCTILTIVGTLLLPLMTGPPANAAGLPPEALVTIFIFSEELL